MCLLIVIDFVSVKRREEAAGKCEKGHKDQEGHRHEAPGRHPHPSAGPGLSHVSQKGL